MAKVQKINGVAKKTASGQNPYRVGGGYWASIEALRTLGMGKMHDHAKIVPAVIKVMTEAGTFKAFKAKKSDSENAFDLEKRLLTNVMVTSRKDYGAPLIEAGMEVRWDGKGKAAGLFRLSDKAAKAVAVKPTAKKAPAKQPAAKQAKAAKADPTVCGRCSQPLVMFKDKGEEKASPTCPDCGWRKGDKKGAVSQKQIALAASATKAK